MVGVNMQQRRLGLSCLALLCSILLSTAQLSVAWAQAQQEAEIAAAVFVDRAVVAYGDGKFDEALKELQEALRLNPESVDALYYQGLVYAALNRAGDARASLEKARGLHPTDLDVAFQLGVLFFNEKEYEKAEPFLRQVYGPEPTRPNIGYYLGFIEYRKKDYREALTLLRGNVPSDDNFAQLGRFYAGLAMSAMGFPREARAEIEEALRLQPVSPLTAPAQRFGEILQRAAEREKFFRGELRLGLFYDTNVTVTPTSSSDLTAQTLRERGKPKSEGQLASLNLAYKWLKTPDWEGDASYRFLQTYNNHATDFNTQSHTPTVGVLYRTPMLDMLTITGLQYSYDFIFLGGNTTKNRFSERWIVNPYFTVVENAENLTTLQFRFQAKDFFNDRKVARREVRDALNYMVGPLHFFIFEQGQHSIKIGYQYDFDDAEGENWIYSGNRLLAGFQYTLPWYDIKLRYDLDHHWRFHEKKHSQLPTNATDTVRRRDREQTHLIGLAKDFWEDFTVAIEYLFDKTKSNLAAFDFARHVVTTSLTWRFDASTFENLGTSLQRLFE